MKKELLQQIKDFMESDDDKAFLVAEAPKKEKIKGINAPSRWNMRIWDIASECYLPVSRGGNDGVLGVTIDGTGIIYLEDGEVNIQSVEDAGVIIERSTGLKDKNGKEIYEGDIVFFFTEHFDKATGGFDGEDEHNATVEWFDNGFAFMDKIPYDPNIECEVIGNIHENPELLEVENER